MALCRRLVFTVGRYAAGLLSFSNTVRNTGTRIPSLIRRSWVSIGISGGLCAVPFVQDKVSHESLIRRTSSLVTDSSNSYLSQTAMALVDTLTLYTQAMQTLSTLYRRYKANIKKLNLTDEEKVWKAILRQRKQVLKYREDCKQFETHWRTAIQLSELAAEAAFNAGADQASSMAQSNRQIGLTHVQQAQQRALEAERELKDSNAENGERLQTVKSPPTEEEMEIPEAYLRED